MRSRERIKRAREDEFSIHEVISIRFVNITDPHLINNVFVFPTRLGGYQDCRQVVDRSYQTETQWQRLTLCSSIVCDKKTSCFCAKKYFLVNLQFSSFTKNFLILLGLQFIHRLMIFIAFLRRKVGTTPLQTVDN